MDIVLTGHKTLLDDNSINVLSIPRTATVVPSPSDPKG
jgi:hypothetical protein